MRTKVSLKHGTFLLAGFVWLFYQYLSLLCNKTSIISKYFVALKAWGRHMLLIVYGSESFIYFNFIMMMK